MRRSVSQMRIVVLGATGATGRHVVAAALERGHEVVAVVRAPGSFSPHDRLLEQEWTDLSDMKPIERALRSADVVISALGGAEKGVTTVCTDAMKTTVTAMNSSGVTRLIVLSAHGVLETHDRSPFSRTVWAAVGEKMKDKETMESVIAGSPLDWTIVRPPMLKNLPAKGKYQHGEDLRIRLWSSIGRDDLARFLVSEAEDAQYVHEYPRIHR